MAVRDGDYQSGSDYNSPPIAQRKGNYETTLKGYNKATENYYETNESSVFGMPSIGGGATSGAIVPKAWIGAESIHNLDTIDTSTIAPKVGTGDITVRGATIDNLSSVNVFDATDYPPYVFGGGSVSEPGYNYFTQKGNVGSGTPVYAKVGNSLLIDAVGEDGLISGSGSSAVISDKWERSIRFTPSTITPGARVFIASKGHTSAANCQWAISYDDTNIYRTIGGTDIVVGATATYLSTTKETRLSLINLGTTDSFAINDTIVRDSQSDGRGVTTSARLEVVGGILASDSDSASTVSNAQGHYRQLCRYGEDRLINPDIIADQQTSAFLNYTTSILIFGHGDSIMNGQGGPSNDRSKCFLFEIETWANSLGYDVLCLNGGVNGTSFESFYPSRLPKPAWVSDTLSYNTNWNNVTRSTRNFRVDIVLGNSGSNEYSNRFSPEIPYNWAKQAHFMKLISAECASTGVPFIYNTTGGHTLPNEQYEADVQEEVNRGLLNMSTYVVDWHTDLVNPSTQIGYSWAFADDVHLSLDGNKWVRDKFKPYLAPLLASTTFTFPETGPLQTN